MRLPATSAQGLPGHPPQANGWTASKATSPTRPIASAYVRSNRLALHEGSSLNIRASPVSLPKGPCMEGSTLLFTSAQHIYENTDRPQLELGISHVQCLQQHHINGRHHNSTSYHHHPRLDLLPVDLRSQWVTMCQHRFSNIKHCTNQSTVVLFSQGTLRSGHLRLTNWTVNLLLHCRTARAQSSRVSFHRPIQGSCRPKHTPTAPVTPATNACHPAPEHGSDLFCIPPRSGPRSVWR